jgi:large subunit ribosomal protein L33
MREIVVLECSVCKSRNYLTTLNTKGGKKIELKKFCRRDRAHTLHRSRKV